MPHLTRLFFWGTAIAGFLVGVGLSPSGSVATQTRMQTGQNPIPAPPLRHPVPLWVDQPTSSVYWSIDDIRKMHTVPESGPPSSKVILETRTHRMDHISHRAATGSTSGAAIQWDEAEEHEGVSDFLVVTGGGGTIVVGGELANRVNLADPAGPVPGEYRGQPIQGGDSYTVKEGDMLAVPPNTPHWAQPGADGLSYLKLRVNVGLYPWNLVR